MTLSTNHRDEGIMMITFTLAAVSKTTVPVRKKFKEETSWEYHGTDGTVVKFCAHPTRAWNWLVDPSVTTANRKIVNQIIDKFCEVTIDRGENSFDEVIKTLEIKG